MDTCIRSDYARPFGLWLSIARDKANLPRRIEHLACRRLGWLLIAHCSSPFATGADPSAYTIIPSWRTIV